ncbi:hypothetical protein [Kineosporia sp. A_224]|uniref:hypothetical protein n=1 Tax=Kineosporia sp. A_224 TaxID=1962180 RepID=UPI000B4BF86A|nr:hypothetical protein [Kineosporia sp. A_224]
MITDRSAPGPRANPLGAAGRGPSTAALAGLVAEIAFIVLMALVALVSSVLLPGCEGDSCIGSPRSYAAVLVSPLVLLVAFAGALLAFRVRRAWVVALAALPVALVLLAAAVAVLLGVLRSSLLLTLLAAALAVMFGPLSAVSADTLVNGRGPMRFVAAPAVVAVVVLVVVASQLLGPGFRAGKVTALAPQPYAYDAPGATLSSLTANESTGVLELEYLAADESVSVHEFGPLTAAERAGECPPELPIEEPPGLCRRLPSPTPGVTIWRRPVGSAGTGDPYVLVARPDVTLVLLSSTMPDDAGALALVARLRPVEAGTLLDDAEYVFV